MDPRTWFVVEYLFLAVVVLAAAPSEAVFGLLGGGLFLHLLNANAFFGFTKTNPFGTPRRFAVVTLVGYVAAIGWFVSAWQ